MSASTNPSNRTDFYQTITNKIIAELEAGQVPWVQHWAAGEGPAPLGMPTNAANGRPYSGINILILWDAVIEHGFATQGWMTFRQALSLGGHVRKGERGTTVVYADRFTPDSERQRALAAGEDARAIPFLKEFTVFNVAQCDGLPTSLAEVPEPTAEGLILPQVDTLIRNSGADLRLGGDQAFYAPAHDYIQVPRPERFFEPINWHRTAIHELAHWSGASHRLARDLSGGFGSNPYAREELVAEMAAAFCCATLGIIPTVRHADYLAIWLDVLREDSRAIVRAASAASKAADFLLGFLPGAGRAALCQASASGASGEKKEGGFGIRDGLKVGRVAPGARHGDLK